MELDLDQARRRAKELLRAARAGDPDALARMRDDRAPRLADAQRAVAADLGFASWPALVEQVEAARGDRGQRRTRLMAAARSGHDADAERLARWASAGDDEAVARLLDAGVPLDARGVDDGTALHYAGIWGRASTVELLLARGAEVDAMGGPPEHPGTALAWTAWGSRELPGAAQRLEGYTGAAAALLGAGARVTEGIIEVAADEVAVLFEEAADRTGVLRETGLSYLPGRPIRISVRRRGIRYDIDDMGGAVAVGGRPPGWHEAAERAVRARGWNVSRGGVVFVQAVESRDIDALVLCTGEASAAVLEALFALEE